MHGVHVKYSTFGIIMVSFCLGIFVLWGIAAGVFSEDASFSVKSGDNAISLNSSKNHGNTVRNYDRSINPVNYEQREPKSTTITVTVMDNKVPVSSNVQVYKNGEFIQSVYMLNGRHVFNNLEYGMYKFVVTDPDYTTSYYDAIPSQLYFDYDIGEVELSSRLNTISYYVRGNIEGSTADAYQDDYGTGGVSWSNVSIGEIDDKVVQSFTIFFELLKTQLK